MTSEKEKEEDEKNKRMELLHRVNDALDKNDKIEIYNILNEFKKIGISISSKNAEPFARLKEEEKKKKKVPVNHSAILTWNHNASNKRFGEISQLIDVLLGKGNELVDMKLTGDRFITCVIIYIQYEEEEE